MQKWKVRRDNTDGWRYGAAVMAHISGELHLLLADLGTSQRNLFRISSPCESFESIQLMALAASENTDSNQLMTQAENNSILVNSRINSELYPGFVAGRICQGNGGQNPLL